MFHVPEQFRKPDRRFGLGGEGNFGAFALPAIFGSRELWSIASDGEGWEHVSIHVWENNKYRLPTWTEMCYVKELFWDEEDVVMQLHPKRSEYVNCHPYVLHLWRPIGQEIPTPPAILVGPTNDAKENTDNDPGDDIYELYACGLREPPR
jgi:hypothetical protein